MILRAMTSLQSVASSFELLVICILWVEYIILSKDQILKISEYFTVLSCHLMSSLLYTSHADRIPRSILCAWQIGCEVHKAGLMVFAEMQPVAVSFNS